MKQDFVHLGTIIKITNSLEDACEELFLIDVIRPILIAGRATLSAGILDYISSMYSSLCFLTIGHVTKFLLPQLPTVMG